MAVIIMILIVVGLVPLVACIIKMKMVNAFKRKSVVTNATVTNLEVRQTKGGKIYRTTVEYKTEKAERYITTVSLVKKQITDKTVRLMYLPDDPTKFSVDFGERLPYFLTFSIVFFLLVVWLCVWLGIREYTV